MHPLTPCGLSGPCAKRVFLCLLAAAGLASAQENPDAVIARETSDPTSNAWYLYTNFGLSTFAERDFASSNQAFVELQPSLPVALTEKIRLLNYPDLVLSSDGVPGGRQITGIESFSWVTAVSPSLNRFGFSWGIGPAISFPVSTSSALASSQWQFGPGGVLAWRSENFVASALVKSTWTTSGPGREAGSFQVQYNLQYFFGNGSQIGLARPRVEYNWDRRGRGGWDVPVGLDVARVFHFGKLPVKIVLEYEFYVLNDSRWSPEHLFQITFIPVVTSPLSSPVW